MSVTKLPSGRWRAQVHQPGKGNVSVSKILGGPGTFATQKEAKRAREKARDIVAAQNPEGPTLGQFRDRWITDPLFKAPKESTNLHNAERTKAFCAKHAQLPIRTFGTDAGDELVSQWLSGGKRNSQVPALRKMFNDAMSVKGGRLLARNPFSGLGISKTRGNRDVDPPDEATVWKLIDAAHKLSIPSFACWLQVAAFTGMRPGELDALRWENVDFEQGRIRVVEQWSSGSKTFTLPKNGKKRWAPMPQPAREGLLAVPNEGTEFVFVTSRRTHWTPGARAYHWKAAKASVGFGGSLYLATRHFAGWYMRNVLALDAEDVAVALGHEDGGYQVRMLYGHLDRDLALRRVQNAYEGRANVRPLRREAG